MEFFVVGTVAFWFLIIGSFITMMVFTELERPVWGLTTLLGLFAVLHFFGNFNILSAMADHPLQTVFYVLGYFISGTLWSIAKWFFFVRRHRENYLETKEQYLSEHTRQGVKDLDGWTQSFERSKLLNQKRGLQPLVQYNKGRIMTWMMYWPWSCVWTLIDDPIKKAFKIIFERIRGWLQKISDKAFTGIE